MSGFVTARREPASLHDVLWVSLEPFEARWRKSAAALVAIHDALAGRERPTGAQAEFLALYRWALGVPPPVFTAVWKAPSAFAWVREAYERLGRRLAGEDSDPQALDRHLGHFKGLALGMAAAGGLRVEFEKPYEVELPCSLPGTGRLIAGAGSAGILGWADGAPVGAAGAVEVVAAPVVELDGARVELDPYALRGLGLDVEEFRPAVEAGLDFHRESRPLVLAALRHVRRHAPDTFRQLAAVVRCIGLKRFVAGDPTSNSTDSRLPGAFLALRIGSPWDLGETLIHEFHHNRLFVLEEERPIFAVEEHPELGIDLCYSPWRSDPRPLRGVLHAIYVTIPVTHYWLSVLADGDAPPDVLDYARDRVRRASFQLEIALELVGRLADLTDDGRAIVAELDRSVAALEDEIADSGLPPDVPSFRCTHRGEVKPDLADDGRPLTVRESVLRHVERYDSRGDVPAPALRR